MSHTTAFGPGSAFASFPTSTRGPPRRVNSSGSFKEDHKTGGGGGGGSVSNTAAQATGDQSQESGSGGGYGGSLGQSQPFDHNTELSGANSGSIHSLASHRQNAEEFPPTPSTSTASSGPAFVAPVPTNTSQRSFSSILSPTLNSSTETENENSLAKPFYYSREFILKLYDESKASKRPIELASHAIATREEDSGEGGSRDGGGRKPWALRVWRDGEKELFSTSIHPQASRVNRLTPHRNGVNDPFPFSSTSSGTASSTAFNLASLGVLPRERDRATLATGRGTAGGAATGESTAPASTTSLTPSSGGDKDLSGLRRARNGGASADSGVGIMGIVGGVLGGIGLGSSATPNSGAAPARSPFAAEDKKEAASEDSKESQKWIRGLAVGQTDDHSASHDETNNFNSSTALGEAVTSSAAETSLQYTDEKQDPQNEARANGLPSDPDMAKRTTSLLGSLPLDADPSDDAILLQHSQSTHSDAPPGLTSLNPATAMWQYRDPSGQVQGPFTGSMMHDWYRQNFFSPDLLVKRIQEPDFETLAALSSRVLDKSKPFLTAPLRTVLPRPASNTWSLGRSSPLIESAFSSNERSLPGSFYENQQNSKVASPSLQAQPSSFGFGLPQNRSVSQGLDPWGAPLPLPSTTSDATQSFPVSAWNNGGFGSNLTRDLVGNSNATFHTQAPSSGNPLHGLQSEPPRDLLAQLLNQQQHQQLPQSAAPDSSFHDSNQLTTPTTHPDWSRLSSVLSPASSHSLQTQMGSAWAPLPSADTSHSLARQIKQDEPPSALAHVPSPIGPPPPAPIIAQVTPHTGVDNQSLPATPQKSRPVAESDKTRSSKKQSQATPTLSETSQTPTKVSHQGSLPSKKSSHKKEGIAKSVEAPVETAESNKASSQLTPAPAAAPVVKVAPWIKGEEKMTSSPSLREIQEIEARQAESRKASEQLIAERQQMLASVQAAQRAAAAEAESLPVSSTWATESPVGKSSSPAPWLGAKSSSAGKTLKEIQEEEESRRKKAALLATQRMGAAAGARGYAGSIGQGATASATGSAGWTTVAVKPATTPVTPTVKPIIPGASMSLMAGRIASLPAKPAPATSVSASARGGSGLALAAQPISRSQTSSRSNGAAVFDADSPPPPSAEFVSWCKEALKGLTVPMDEFIQMLLSFPLDASADVLEIISDSVYANSSTLDGRRFANEFSSRRQLDVSARYPSILMGKSSVGGNSSRTATTTKPTSMADALKNQPVSKAPEWSVKVAGGKKKKGGKS